MLSAVLFHSFFACIALPQAQEVAPHASQPIRIFDYRDDERADWVELAPSWLTEGRPELLSEAARQALGRHVAELNRWDDSVRRTWLEASHPRPIPFRYRLTEEASGKVLLAGSEQVWAGQPVLFSDVSSRSVVVDYEVEVAQSAIIAEPVPGHQHAGVSLAMLLLPVPGVGWQAEFALVVSDFGETDPIDLGYYAIAGKDRLRQKLVEVGWSTLFPSEGSTVVRLPQAGGAGQLILELNLDAGVPPRAVPAGSLIKTVAVPTLAARPNWPQIVARLEQDGETWSTREGYLALTGNNASDQLDRLQEILQAGSRSYDCELRVLSEVDGQPETLGTLQAVIVQGQPLRFAAGEISQALTRWRTEVASQARVAAPQFESFLSGMRGEMRARGAGGAPGTIELALELTRVVHGASQNLRLSGESRADANLPSSRPLPSDRVRIENPELNRLVLGGAFQPDEDGRLVLEREGQRFLGRPGKVRVELRVRPIL